MFSGDIKMFWASARISWSGSKAPGGRELWQSRRKFDADVIDPEIKARREFGYRSAHALGAHVKRSVRSYDHAPNAPESNRGASGIGVVDAA